MLYLPKVLYLVKVISNTFGKKWGKQSCIIFDVERAEKQNCNPWAPRGHSLSCKSNKYILK